EIGTLTESFNKMVKDIQEGRRRLEERQAQLSTLHAMDRAMSSTLSLPAVLNAVAEEIHRLAGVDRVAIYLLDNDGNLTMSTSRGLRSRSNAEEDWVKLEDLARRALLAGSPTLVEATPGQCEGGATEATSGCIAMLMTFKGLTLGAVLFCTNRAAGFSPEEKEFLYSVTLQASVAVENARLYGLEQRRVAELESLSMEMKQQRDELKQAQEGIVETLYLSLQAKDHYTRGHADRVGLLARRIAGRMGLPRERQEVLAQAARLHDIGKISIPEHLLNKEGALTPPERTQFELHPERSAELLRYLPDLDEVLPAIRGHHERYDSKGYPDGLAGEEIPLEARIIAVADAYDALTTDRPYRPALSHEEALKVLRANVGPQWDPQVIQVVLEFFQEGEPARGR
ncbi:MAG: HD domain-containing protein, partial [Dehalococcoidia bacterium]|nr:HD domain-containing protein [Dehalococcoidia bacterium]